jgi:hypothetical protein
MTATKDLTAEKQKLWRSHLSYSMVLLIMMIGSGTAAGIYSYNFGKEALRGVRPSPPSVRLPTVKPTPISPALQKQ